MLGKHMFWHRSASYISILALLLIFLRIGAPAVYAQDSTNQDSANQESADKITRNEVNEVASELYCPLCSGVRLDACELQACEQMREEIALQLANGADKASIKASFLTQYGPQVLGEPPRNSLLNWLAWILPFAALGIAGVWLLVRGRQLGQAQAVVATSSTPAVSPHSEQNGQVPPPRATDDEYTRKLNEELRQYE